MTCGGLRALSTDTASAVLRETARWPEARFFRLRLAPKARAFCAADGGDGTLFLNGAFLLGDFA